MAEPAVATLGVALGRKKGRPKSGRPLRRSFLTIRLRDEEHDAIIKAANLRGKKVATFARATVMRDVSAILRDSLGSELQKAS